MKHPKRISIGSIILLTALVVGIGHAEQGQPSGPPGPPINQVHPGPLGLANFGKIISGEFTGDLKRDAVLMDGSQPKMLFAPEVYDTAIPVGGPANDVATLSGLLPHQDYVLTVGYAGLVRHQRISAESRWESITLRDDTTNWAAARRIAVGNLDGIGAPDLVGIGANGRDVLIEYGNLDGTYTPGTTFLSLGTPIVTDVWLLNWTETGDVSGGDEIALNSGAGIQIRRRTAQYLGGINWSYSPILGTVIDDDDSPTVVQRLALVSKVSGIDRFSLYGATDSEPYFNLGAAGVVSMASGDADGDGDTEVFLSVTSENKFWRMDNQSPAATSFTATPITKYSFGPPGRNPSLNHAGLAPADFDSDGALDVLALAQGDPGPQPVVWGSFDLVNVESDVVAGWRPSINRVIYITSTNELEFHFTRPLTILQAPVGAVTKLGVKIFHTPALGIGTEPEPHRVGLVNMPLAYGYTVYRMSLSPEFPDFSLENSHDLFSFVVRQTAVQTSTGHVLDIAPAMTAIFTPEPGVTTVSHAPNTLQWLPTLIDPTSTPTFGGLDIGPTVPSLDDDKEPEDKDETPP